MPAIPLPCHNRMVTLRLPDDVRGEVAAPRAVNLPIDSSAAIRAALDSPIGTPPVEELVRSGSRVAVVIDDITRETPTALLLSHLLPRLRQAGVRPDDLSIVIALGTHRPMTPAEIKTKVSSRIAANYRVINTPCTEKECFSALGKSAGGIPVRVNQAVAEADVRIGLGMIIPHLDTGYGGGAKILLPGVCGQDTIAAFHARMAQITGNQLGRQDAQLRLELESFVRQHVPLDFIINVIPDRNGSLYRTVAGHPTAAHRAGAVYAREVFGAGVSQLFPVVICNAHPHHIDFWQASKALASGELMTDDGGTLILLAACPEDMGRHPLFARYVGMDPGRLTRMIRENRAEDPVAAPEAVAVCRMRQRLRIVLVSEGIEPQRVREMGMVHYTDIETAVKKELTAAQGGKVGILTHGGVLVPMVR